MKKVLQINIDTPCSENWNNFPKTVSDFTVTGHCASCSKNVIDFTSWSDERIKEYFEQRPSNICGRLKNTQLKEYFLPEKPKRTYQGLFSLLLTAFMVFSSKLTEAQSTKKKNYTTELHSRQNQTPATKQDDAKEDFIIRGKVVAVEDNSALPGVNVIQKGTLNGTVTQIDGTFELSLISPKENEVLVLAFIGLKTQEVLINTNTYHSDLILPMETDVFLLGEVMLGGIGYRTISPRRWWWSLKELFTRY